MFKLNVGRFGQFFNAVSANVRNKTFTGCRFLQFFSFTVYHLEVTTFTITNLSCVYKRIKTEFRKYYNILYSARLL